MANHRAGGGIKSAVNNRSAGYKTTSRVRGVQPGGVDQLGRMLGNHTTEQGKTRNPTGARMDLYGGPSFQKTPFGNEVAAATVCGPGGSRNLYGKSGTNQIHGNVNPGHSPPRRDILSDYGPDYRAKGSR